MANETASAGATPAAGGATPPQSPPAGHGTAPAAAAPTAASDLPATGDSTDALGEPGKRALESERRARKAAEDAHKAASDELAALKAAGQTDQEKAIAQARKEAAAEVTGTFQAQLRLARVEAALTAAGIEPSLLDLAAKAGEFASLKITDDGRVEGLDDAIAALKKDRPALFKAPVAGGGTADGGTRGQPALTKEAIAKMTPDQINANWDAVSKALASGSR